MSENKYRLIRFSQREQDNLRTEGAGAEKDYPWTLRGEELRKHSEFLKTQLMSIITNQDFKISDIPYILEVDIIDKAKAKSHQSKLLKMFEVDSTPSQLGMLGENKLYLKLDNEESVHKTLLNLSEVEKNKNSISSIDEIKAFKAPLEISNDKNYYKIKFINFGDSELNSNVKNKVKSYLSERNIVFEEFKYTRDETVLEISNISFDDLNFIRELPVHSIEPMPFLEDPFPDVAEIEGQLEVLDFDYSKVNNYPLLGLLDSGVEELPHLAKFVVKGNGCNYQEHELNKDHGTFIANLLINGNVWNNSRDSSIEGCIIVDVPIAAGSVREATLVQNIRDAISKNKDVKIWSLSVSIGGEVSADKFSDYAIALDDIQKEYNVLIIKSAGNDPDSYLFGNIPGKLSKGADSVRAITVGSISRETDSYNVSKANYPSLYSRIGRGPSSIIKPDVVHYGGDLFANVPVPQSVVDYTKKSEKSILSDGSIVEKVGTSYSTPKVAKLAAELALALGMDNSNFDPLLIRALIVHSANYLGINDLTSEDKLIRLGFGKPSNSEYILNEDDYTSTTLILKGNLRKKNRIDIMDFPYPRNLIKDGKFIGRLKATLVYDNYLESKMGPEYCQSNIVLRMGTYDSKFDRDTTKQNILNPIGRSDSKNILKTKVYSKRLVHNNKEFQNERTLIEFGDKYYPVKKFASDLEELTEANQNNMLNEDRNWFLFLEGQYRDFIYKKMNFNDELLSMDFVLIITITDPDGQRDVHSETINQLGNLGFNYEHIELDENIYIQLDNQ